MSLSVLWAAELLHLAQGPDLWLGPWIPVLGSCCGCFSRVNPYLWDSLSRGRLLLKGFETHHPVSLGQFTPHASHHAPLSPFLPFCVGTPANSAACGMRGGRCSEQVGGWGESGWPVLRRPVWWV